LTEVELVAHIDGEHPGFMRPCTAGEAGYFVTRGENVMAGYVGDPEATARVMYDEWYLGLRDIGFFLENEEDGQRDYYWMSRDSMMLIKGGANYAYDQINAEIRGFLARHLSLSASGIDVAVVGLRLESEHEDTCCVTIDLGSADSDDLRARIRELLDSASAELSKAARPGRLRFGPVPRNFKGAILVNDLAEAFAD
jgi:long-chain acyl-CoA synthetase